MKKFVWLLTLIVISTSLFTPAVAAINKDNIEEKFIYGCGVEENLKPYGDYVEEVVSESSGFIALEMANVFSDSEEYINLLKKRDSISKVDVEKFIAQTRKECKDFYRKQRNDFLLSSGIDSSLVKESEYSNYLEVDKSILKNGNSVQRVLNKMTKSNLVKSIFIENHEDLNLEPANWFGTWEGETLPTINGDIVSSGYYTGEGVNVGIIEALYVGDGLGGYIAENDLKDDFPDIEVEPRRIENNSYGNRIPIGDHALKVARVIGNMAPKIKLFTSLSMYNTYEDISGSVEFMIENNVNVVNCSWGNQSNGTYCWQENYFNQISLDNFITFVFAAGNDNGKTVSCPSNAANVICVGATDATGKKLADYSNYGSNVHSGCKPNIVANGAPHLPQDRDSFHSFKGTSFAAPMITGAIAMVFGNDARYKLFPERITPQLAATANKLQIKDYNENQFGMDQKAGAGMLDIHKFLSHYSKSDAFWINKTGEIDMSNEYYIPIETDIGKNLIIYLFWMSTESFSQSSNLNPNLLQMQLKATVGKTLLGTITSDGVKSNMLMLRVPINSLTPVKLEVFVTGQFDGKVTKGAIGFCLE